MRVDFKKMRVDISEKKMRVNIFQKNESWHKKMRVNIKKMRLQKYTFTCYFERGITNLLNLIAILFETMYLWIQSIENNLIWFE